MESLRKSIADLVGQEIILRFFSSLSPREKCLLSCYDTFLASYESQDDQYALRDAVSDYKVEDFPLEILVLESFRQKVEERMENDR